MVVGETPRTARHRRSLMYSCILVANDGSTLGRKAFRHGLQLASHLRARLAVVVAIEPVVGLFGVTGTSGSNKN
ncbi:MAG TPA: hypothetical protein VFO36_02890, partial [Nitrospiraceae bacterium]|nr:hypothetical protein [Nitrospiraceae bacterium]